MTDYEIVIVGAGPSGCAAALMLSMLDSSLAEQTLLLDKAVFPRPKLCAGGVTVDAAAILIELAVPISVPSIPINLSQFLLPDGMLTCHQRNQFQIVRRADFDNALFQTAQRRGVRTDDGDSVESITRTTNDVIVRTSKNEYRAKVVIGADGANSITRKLLKSPRARNLMMALEVFVPIDLIPEYMLPDNAALFDFTISRSELPGYFWIFPTLDDRLVSMGVMEAPFHNNEFGALKLAFAKWLRTRGVGLDNFDLQAHPAKRYEPRGSFAGHRLLLVGDALGIDPLFGEGITSALATGVIAAHSAFDAIRKGDFSFADYETRIRTSYVGQLMRRRCIVARRLWGHRRANSHDMPDYQTLFNWVAPVDIEEGTSLTWEPFVEFRTSI